MTNEDDMPFEDLPPAGEAFVQLPIPGISYSVVHLPMNPSWTIEEWVSMTKRLVDALEATFPQPEAPQYTPAPQQQPAYAQQRPPQQPQQGYPPRQQAQSVVFDPAGNPCCGVHKTREGFPRPMKDWGDGSYGCTAKKRDNTYCTNKYQGDGVVAVRDPF